MNKRYFLISRWFMGYDTPINYSVICFEDKSPEWIDKYLADNYKKYTCEELTLQVI